MDLRPLTDAELLARLGALVRQERENVADVVEHLAELLRRNSVEDTGHHSPFDYCVRALRYSEAAAYARISAAKAALKDDRVISDLRTGAVHLEAVCRLAPHMTTENSGQLLDLASGASKREIQALAVSLGAPPAPEKDVMRVVAAAPCPPSAEVIPPPQRLRIAFTADDVFLRMLERLRALRRHKFPYGGLADLLKESVMVHLSKLEPDLGVPARHAPQKRASARRRRWIPRAVRRVVWQRDGGRCTFMSPDGILCGNEHFLEYDHIVPFAIGGKSDNPENIRLLCRAHNQRLARKRFGPPRLPALAGQSR
jgi:hypothetical protein